MEIFCKNLPSNGQMRTQQQNIVKYFTSSDGFLLIIF